MSTVLFAATAEVVTTNVAVVVPAATVTAVGSCATLVLLLDNATVIPPIGAALLSVAVPVDELPPITLAGLRVTEARPSTAAGVTVKVAVCVEPNEPLIVTAVFALTALVVMAKVAFVFPLRTTMLAGVCTAAVLLLDSVTMAPPDGAGPLRVRVPVAPVPPTTVVGVTESDVSTMAGGAPP